MYNYVLKTEFSQVSEEQISHIHLQSSSVFQVELVSFVVQVVVSIVFVLGQSAHDLGQTLLLLVFALLFPEDGGSTEMVAPLSRQRDRRDHRMPRPSADGDAAAEAATIDVAILPPALGVSADPIPDLDGEPAPVRRRGRPRRSEAESSDAEAAE